MAPLALPLLPLPYSFHLTLCITYCFKLTSVCFNPLLSFDPCALLTFFFFYSHFFPLFFCSFHCIIPFFAIFLPSTLFLMPNTVFSPFISQLLFPLFSRHTSNSLHCILYNSRRLDPFSAALLVAVVRRQLCEAMKTLSWWLIDLKQIADIFSRHSVEQKGCTALLCPVRTLLFLGLSQPASNPLSFTFLGWITQNPTGGRHKNPSPSQDLR